jgi:hypothetical protein
VDWNAVVVIGPAHAKEYRERAPLIPSVSTDLKKHEALTNAPRNELLTQGNGIAPFHR